MGLYLNPPEKALVISVDEKPSIQALERKTGYVETDNGKIVRAYKSTYKRHGTLNLFAALESYRDTNRLAGDTVTVVIRPAADVPWEYVVDAYNQAVRAKFKKIGFSPQ